MHASRYPMKQASARRWLAAALTALLALAGCAGLSPTDRLQQADQWAAQAGWQRQRVATDAFVLMAYVPQRRPQADTLTVYIEGDGLAWLSQSEVSPDPTPRNPVGLQLALRHPAGAAAYLARPCQYVQGQDARHCNAVFWTDARFAPDVVQATDQALTVLMRGAGARRLVLVGYSGGAAVAALVAARRKDVQQLVTVAGNLDTEAWTRLHHVSPLRGSLNPADAWAQLQGLPQLHFAGAQDRVVPPQLAQGFVNRFPENQRPQLRVLEGQDHGCCWAAAWPALAAEAFAPQ